jgi:hypothetical protein
MLVMSYCALLLIHYCADDKIEMNEMGWYVSRMGEGRGVYRVLVRKLGERDHWGDPDVDGE